MNVTMCGEDVESKSVAQGGGGSFKNRKPKKKNWLLCESRQSESTDGPKGGWSCVFLSGHLTHNCWM